jgi:hypothetical protein
MVALNVFFLIFLSIFEASRAQLYTTCDSTTTYTGANQVSYISWPESGSQKTFCTYTFKAPVGFYLRASISYYLAGTGPSCSSNQYVAASIDNMPNWDGYTKFCGYKSGDDPIVVQSIGNELKLGVSSSDFSQYVDVVIEALPLEQGKCDCG